MPKHPNTVREHNPLEDASRISRHLGSNTIRGSEPGRPEDFQISYDDEKLMTYLLYPDMGPQDLYDKLINSPDIAYRQPWEPEAQLQAQKGMRELFDVALLPIVFGTPGIKGARTGLHRLVTDPGKSDYWQKLNQYYHRRLAYQHATHPSELERMGDFLHFGVNWVDDRAPDRLKVATRVYVTPKMESVGHVAASVIQEARDSGYEPYGKVWDESSNGHGIKTRADRLIFYPRTATQLDIIQQALRTTHDTEPGLFLNTPMILTKKSDVPGVGLAESPLKVGNNDKSYTDSRVALLEEAWDLVLEKFAGPDNSRRSEGVNHRLVDERTLRIRHAIEHSELPLSTALFAFREAVQQLSPKHHVSPFDVTRNL